MSRPEPVVQLAEAYVEREAARIRMAAFAHEVAGRVYRYVPDRELNRDLLRELFAPTLFWVYVGGRCVGTAEPDSESGGLRIYVLPLLWQDEGDQA